MKQDAQLTAVEWLYEQMPKKIQPHYKKQLEQAKKMEDSQATDYAKWSLGIYELHARFFTFLEWIKDDPKDENLESKKPESKKLMMLGIVDFFGFLIFSSCILLWFAYALNGFKW